MRLASGTSYISSCNNCPRNSNSFGAVHIYYGNKYLWDHYLNKLRVANDSFSRWALDPITSAMLLATSPGWVSGLTFTVSLRLSSNFVRSSNFEAPSASANRIRAPLALWTPWNNKKLCMSNKQNRCTTIGWWLNMRLKPLTNSST